MPITDDEVQAAKEMVAKHGSVLGAAKAEHVSESWIRRRVAKLRDPLPVVNGRVQVSPRSVWPVPPKGSVYRYIFTCAQNNTRLHDGVWRNLVALADHLRANIYVATFTYNKAAYGSGSVKRGTKKTTDADPIWYPPEIEKHVLDESVIVAPGLVWCGNINILPTAARPLSGFDAYTGRKSGIFPHVKFAMQSVPSGKFEGTKFNYTTGTVTQRNYIQKKEGQKAEFHHGYGGLLVEVDSDGDWFVRQLNADSEGTIYDLDLRAKGGKVTGGHGVEAITWGDIHVGTVPPEVQIACWGEGGMLDALRPKYQFLHDTLDFRSRNHHERHDPHKNFEKFILGKDDVFAELAGVADFLARLSYREWCQSVVVDSNHDNALMRWLREADYRTDPKNALFFLRAQTQVYSSIYARDLNFHMLEWSMRDIAETLKLTRMSKVTFLRPDESFITCRDANGGIENGNHGHLGANGAYGGLNAFAKMGRKSNTGHTHTAGIVDGAMSAGVTGDLDQGFNAGPSSWSRTHIVTYRNGKRTLVTMWRHKWRACT